MSYYFLFVVLSAVLAAFATRASAAEWRDFLLPFPQECSFGFNCAPPQGKLTLHLPASRPPVAEQIAQELGELLGERLEGDATYDVDSIGLALAAQGVNCDQLLAEARRKFFDRVANAPNSEQAYALVVEAEGSRWHGVVAIARGGAGLYYAHKTLKQLFQATLGSQSFALPLTLPRAEIVDWPDMPERGEWGGYALEDIAWLADRKMNLVEDHAKLSIDDQGKGHASYPEEKLALARRHAVKLVPIITHLDQLERTGIFERHPQVLAKGGPEGWTNWGELLKPVCFAEPAAVQLMTEWMEDLARIEGVDAITVWLSEAYGECKCPECSKTNQFVMETRAALQAWRQARRIKPNLELRILLTQGSYKYNEAVLAEIPVGEGVGVIYYHGSLTYNPFRREMIEPYMAEFVQGGGWLGVCPTLTASWAVVSPFSCPQFIQERMEEYHAKGLKCLYGYATPGNRWWDMNVQGAAEWGWNRKGRDVGAFVRAWAARRGIQDPDAAVAWADLVGQAAWDVYAGGVPYPWFRGGIGRTLSEHKPLVFGEGPFASIPDSQRLDEDIERVRRALPLAAKTAADDLIAETGAIGGYVEMLSRLKELSEIVARCEGKAERLLPADKDRLSSLMAELDQIGARLVESLWKWGRAVALGPNDQPPGRFWNTVNDIEGTVAEAGAACEKLGVEDPGRPYRWHKIGTWKTEDFDQQSPVVRKFEVTEHIRGAGTYTVRFDYRSGLLGLSVKKVRLLSSPVQNPEELREEAVDAHDCHAGAWVKDNLYSLAIPTQPEGRKWFVEVTMAAGDPRQPRDTRTSNGDIFFAKQRQ